MPKIVVVVPTIRPESHASFVKAWTPLFEKHSVTLVTVWDGESPSIEEWSGFCKIEGSDANLFRKQDNILDKWVFKDNRDLFCRYTDACRNLGFVVAAHLGADIILTLDDDVYPSWPLPENLQESNYVRPIADYDRDPIQAHLDVLDKRVPISWMNTSDVYKGEPYYLRGMPYAIREEAPVMVSHGVWDGVPDFDGETQLRLQESPAGLPKMLPYHVGPVPKGVLFPLCGMNLAFRREALPYVYFAPMGPDSGVVGLNRFADIWMGVFLKRQFDALGLACYTGASTVYHSRASDAKKNVEQERLGREWNERIIECVDGLNVGKPMNGKQYDYFKDYAKKRERYAGLIRSILSGASK